jgi:hypothetical protein
MPFCREHASKLEDRHKKKIWDTRPSPGSGACGLCNGGLGMDYEEEWLGLCHLALSVLLELDFGGCGAPKSNIDDDGFCWSCGILNAERNEVVAKKIVEKLKQQK